MELCGTAEPKHVVVGGRGGGNEGPGARDSAVLRPWWGDRVRQVLEHFVEKQNPQAPFLGADPEPEQTPPRSAHL